MSSEIEQYDYNAVLGRADNHAGANHWRQLAITNKERMQMKRPIQAPFDVDARRLDVKRTALAGAFVLGALLVATLGAQIVLWSIRPGEVLYLGVGFGLVIMLCSLAFGGMTMFFVLAEWQDHRKMLLELHEVYLASIEASGAAETIEYTSEIELSTDNPAHVLLAALWVHLRQQQGTENAFTVRNLYGPVFLAERRVGDISKLTAERMGQTFAQLGMVIGRSERRAGIWTPRNADEIIRLLIQNWR